MSEADTDPAITVAFVDPAITDEALAGHHRQHHGDDAAILAPTSPPTAMSPAERATRHLDATGWVLPEGVVHAGRLLGDRSRRPDAAAWLAAFERASPGHESALGTVRSPAALVETLERLLADGAIPAPTGWATGGDRLVAGDKDALAARHDAIAATLPGFDVGIAAESLGRSEPLELARDALVHYLGWCLDAGIVTRGMRLAVATHTTAPPAMADDVLLLSAGLPEGGELAVATRAADTSLTVAVPIAPVDHHTAWPLGPTELVRAIERRLPAAQPVECRHVRVTDDGLTFDQADPAALPPVPADRLPDHRSSVWVDDPLEHTIERLEALVGDDGTVAPGACCVVVPTRRHARRFMRLCATRGVPAARAGTIDPFATRVATLSLAWLRILEGIQTDRAWAVVLDAAGCTWGDLETWLDTEERPAAFASLRGELGALDSGPAVIAAVAERYGADSRATDALLAAVTRDDVPTPAATLRRLEGDAEAVALGPPPADRVAVRTEAPPEPTEVVLHVVDPPDRSDPAVVYRPPLGIQRTRQLVDLDGHVLERTDGHWGALAPARADGASRSRRLAERSLARATGRSERIGATQRRWLNQQK